MTGEPVPATPSAQEAGDRPAAPHERLSTALPEAVRQRVVALATDALAALGDDEVPGSLKAFRRFTPARRARLVATPIAAALQHDEAFRLRVSARVREALPDLAAALTAGTVPSAADPLDVAAVAYLLRPPGWPELVSTAGDEVRRSAAVAESAAVSVAVARLQEQLSQARLQARADLGRMRQELATVKGEVGLLRRKLHDARQARRVALAEAGAARAEAVAAREESAAASSAADAELRRLRTRLADVEADLDTARRAAREGRAMADARLRLLLDTVVEATRGLRRELALPPAAPGATRPADIVSGISPGAAGVEDVAAHARDRDDPALLDELLSLPRVHLVVDGYNVTKLGYGALPLQAQRERLVSGLATLAARSGAEVTVCFDGAALDAPVVMATPRGVRVLFSLPGETADDLIRRLVDNEPPGRPVVVVSTDREVADGVRASGARPVPSAALLRRLARG